MDQQSSENNPCVYGNDSYLDYYRKLPESLRTVPYPLMLVRCGISDWSSTLYERHAYPFEVWEEVISGSGFVTVNKINFSVRTGDIYRLPAGADHRLEGEKEKLWRKKYFLLAGDMVPLLVEQFGFKEQYHFPGGAQHSKGIFDILIEADKNCASDMHLTAAEQFMKLLWRLKYASLNVEPLHPVLPLSQRLVRIIDQSFEHHLDLDRIAAYLQVSRSHLQTLFKRDIGITPYEYHLRRKFEKAKELLMQSNLTISEIAVRLGFHDRFHFSREFSRRFGIAPAAFRKKN